MNPKLMATNYTELRKKKKRDAEKYVRVKYIKLKRKVMLEKKITNSV